MCHYTCDYDSEAAQMHLIVFSGTRLYGGSNLAQQLKLKQCSDVSEFLYLNKLCFPHLWLFWLCGACKSRKHFSEPLLQR